MAKTLNLSLENNLHQRIGLLSRGRRQAITLLMDAINNFDLLLDEHIKALDSNTAKGV